MRVVNDRRRLPRVAWNGQAVVQTRRGEVRGVGLDLSADGMAVLAPSPGKVKERVRIHLQLGEFPLLTDARVVRMTKRRDGYRWALRFDRLDERMRTNLETFVRQQLANAARFRQGQLYAQRLKGGALPTPPGATPPPPSFTPAPAGVPTPAPVDPRVRAGITLPPEEFPDLGVAAAPEPTEVSLDGLAEVLPHRPVEIELPSMAPGPDQPVLDISDTPPSTQDVYVPYQASSATDEASLLGEGLMTASPTKNPPPVAARPAPEVESTPAEVLAPGVIEISDDEDLSLEDILAEVEAGGTMVPAGSAETPASDLQMPPKQDVAKRATAGLGDVQVLYDDAGEEEATRSRDEPPMDPTVVTGEAAAAPLGAPMNDAPALDSELLADATGLVGAPVDDAPAQGSGLLDPPAGAPMDDAPALDSGLLDDAPALVGAPMADTPALDSGLLDDAPALDSGLLDDAPALVGAPMNLGPAVSGAPLDDGPPADGGLLDDAPALVSTPKADGPALAGAPFSDVPPSARNTLLPGAPEPTPESPPHEFGGAPFISERAEDSDGISLAEFAPAMQRAADEATEEATPLEPENPYATPLPSSPEPYIPVPSNGVPESEADAPLPSHVPTPGPTAAEEAEAEAEAEAEEEVPPEPPALLDPVDEAVPPPLGPPSSALYGDDAEPFDPYAPNPAPTAGAAPARLGSAPRALGELPPVVEGLYTPTSNPRPDEPSGGYRSRSFEPFPSGEEGLYGGRENVSFQEQQGNPRQRLALLQEDDQSTHKLAEQHDLFLGDIEGVTSGATPSAAPAAADVPVVETASEPPAPPTDEDDVDFAALNEVAEVDEREEELEHHAVDSAAEQLAAVRAEAEELQAGVPDQELGANAQTSMHGQPELAEMAPTRPIDLNLEGPEGFTPAPHDVTPAPQELNLDDVEFPTDGGASSPANGRAAATYPEFNVIPDYDQPVDPSSAPSGPPPAQSGHTIVASFEELGLRVPSPEDSVDVDEPSAPSDFAVLPSFGGAHSGAGFTMVASFDAEAEADVGASSTMIATAGDIDAWRSAGVASAEPPGTSAVIPPEFDEEQTGMYTPAPGSLQPLGPPSPPLSAAPLLGSPALHEDALTSMRVGTGGQPSGAGFELNPRGPAPDSAPALPAAGAQVSAPGPSSRRQTNLDSGGRPGPPPKPVVTAPAPDPIPAVVPPVRGSGPVDNVPMPSAPRRSLVEDALAELKRKTDSRRKKRDTLSPIEEKAKAIAEEKKATRQERRRRRRGNAEMVDPAIADLYKAAMTDLKRPSE